MSYSIFTDQKNTLNMKIFNMHAVVSFPRAPWLQISGLYKAEIKLRKAINLEINECKG